MHEAMLYNKESDKIRCRLCHHHCLIDDGKTGVCNVRLNKSGVLYTMFYGKPIALNVDPIEKKPLFHFYPGSTAFSIATPGCNFQCPFCQNWDISQYGRADTGRLPTSDVAPETIVDHKEQVSISHTSPSLRFFSNTHMTAVPQKAQGLGIICHQRI
jgi:pyruvate formate lyase activating enzyme